MAERSIDAGSARHSTEGLAAVVRIDRAHGTVEVFPVNGNFDHARRLRLTLHHPAFASQDLALELAPFDAGWRAAAQPTPEHDWLLQLEPADGAAWRLRGRLTRGDQAVHLQPAIAAGQP